MIDAFLLCFRFGLRETEGGRDTGVRDSEKERKERVDKYACRENRT